MSDEREGDQDRVRRRAAPGPVPPRAPLRLVEDGPDLLERLAAVRRHRDGQLARRIVTSARFLVFLDLDGVLRREHAALWTLEAPLRERFEEALRRLGGADVVISSGWREAFPLSEIREHFAEDIRARIIGATPIASPELRNRTLNYRYHEVMTFMRRPEVSGLPWAALDDDENHYPKRFNVRVLDPAQGFDETAAQWLLELGTRYGAGG